MPNLWPATLSEAAIYLAAFLTGMLAVWLCDPRVRQQPRRTPAIQFEFKLKEEPKQEQPAEDPCFDCIVVFI